MLVAQWEELVRNQVRPRRTCVKGGPDRPLDRATHKRSIINYAPRIAAQAAQEGGRGDQTHRRRDIRLLRKPEAHRLERLMARPGSALYRAQERRRRTPVMSDGRSKWKRGSRNS